jgi:FtsP/CotA-like multicopper oxidase with cupredoxin domain
MPLPSIKLCLATFACFAIGQSAIAQETFRELPVFSAKDKIKIEMSEKEVTIGPFQVKSNVYTITDDKGGSNASQEYAGGLISAQLGDTLDINFINRAANMGDDVSDSNLHTHGLVVRPYADKSISPDDWMAGDTTSHTFGDFQFLYATPEGTTVNPHKTHSMISAGSSIHYGISIPQDHPLGPAWFHPHMHGIAKKQVSGGLSGMIMVGDTRDYGCVRVSNDGKSCGEKIPAGIRQRFMLIKDAQILHPMSGLATMQYDQKADFCKENLNVFSGYCNNGDAMKPGDWVFSINGVMYPSLAVDNAGAEIWTIQNASANVTYDLTLSGAGWGSDATPSATQFVKRGMPFHVISIDGGALGYRSLMKSPGLFLQQRAILMPGSRMEIMVAWRDPKTCRGQWPADCKPSSVNAEKSMQLKNALYKTGGDDWPAVNLAEFKFMPTSGGNLAPAEIASAEPDVLKAALLTGMTMSPPASTTSQLCKNGWVHKLTNGEKRRIYFGIAKYTSVDSNLHEEFVLANTVIASDGSESQYGTQIKKGKSPEFSVFDSTSSQAQLCVPFGTNELWELVNISPEVHNFHIHQNKFAVTRLGRTPSEYDQLVIPRALVSAGNATAEPDAKIQSAIPTDDNRLIHDTIIVPRGSKINGEGTKEACETSVTGEGVKPDPTFTDFQYKRNADGTFVLSDFGMKNCRGSGAKDWSGSIEVTIPFDRKEKIGKYLFHCHILEHEDLGMMSSIRVLSPAQMGISDTTMLK